MVSIGKWSNTGEQMSPKMGTFEPTAMTPSTSNRAV